MVTVGVLLELVLSFFVLLVLARLVADWVQMFARSWHPRGPSLVALELIYSATDPPIRLVRRFVPPLRLGGISLDLSIMIVLFAFFGLQTLNRQLLLR